MSGKEQRPLVPRLRFPEFRAKDGWGCEFGNMIFDQISNKNHNSDLPVLAITQEQGAIPRDMIDYHVSVTDKSLEGYKVVEVGNFIISLRSFQGGIEFSKYRGICSPAYVILRLRSDHSEDYFRHYLKTGRFIARMTKNLEGLRDGKMISYKQFSELNRNLDLLGSCRTKNPLRIQVSRGFSFPKRSDKNLYDPCIYRVRYRVSKNHPQK